MICFILTSNILKKMSVFFMSTVPFFEIKGAIPMGIAVGLEPVTSLMLGFLGSTAVIPLILMVSLPAFESIGEIKCLKGFHSWIFKYVSKKSVKMQVAGECSTSVPNGEFINKNFSALALFMFVAMPVPGTGVWGASLVAGLSNMPKNIAFVTIAFANLISSVFVCFLSMGILS